jgi:hypothetical protein
MEEPTKSGDEEMEQGKTEAAAAAVVASDLKQLFKGIAVVIDDEIASPSSTIRPIIDQLKAGGCHVVELADIPAEEESLANLNGASFFVMDWQLLPTTQTAEDGTVSKIDYPRTVLKQEKRRKLSFLKRLAKQRLAPMFIFTGEKLEEVKDALASDGSLYVEGEPTHILVENKGTVVGNEVFNVLAQWINSTPSALVLKKWEQEYEVAKNAMFYDFYTKTTDWPVLLWKTFGSDGVPASAELGRLITRIIFSRMTPFEVDLAPFVKDAPTDAVQAEAYRKKLVEVLERECFVPSSGLHADSIAPGDVFKRNGNFYINIRPDCDCIGREGAPVELYLLKGEALSPARLEDVLDRSGQRLADRDDQAVVFGMHEGRTVAFKFKTLEIKAWTEIKDHRIGRLLPPFLTRLQQRYSAYLQRPGLPLLPSEAMPPAS